MGYYGWRPYVPVAKKRRQAERKLATLNKQRRSVAPVIIEGRTIAKSFWGTSWCINLERYSDPAARKQLLGHQHGEGRTHSSSQDADRL